MQEKRRHNRIPLELPVILRHMGRIIPATALNVSSGGMYLRAEQADISGNHPVEVIFDLDDGERDLSLRGQVTRIEEDTDGTGMGVQFTNLFSESHKALSEYLRRRLH
jgi:uncharacterized protein (TIGR02266 family)